MSETQSEHCLIDDLLLPCEFTQFYVLTPSALDTALGRGGRGHQQCGREEGFTHILQILGFQQRFLCFLSIWGMKIHSLQKWTEALAEVQLSLIWRAPVRSCDSGMKPVDRARNISPVELLHWLVPHSHSQTWRVWNPGLG